MNVLTVSICLLAFAAGASGRSLAQVDASFNATFNFLGSEIPLNNSQSNVTPDESGASQLAGSFISSAGNGSFGGTGLNSAIFGNDGAQTSFGFDGAFTSFGGVTNSTAAFATRTRATENGTSLTIANTTFTAENTGVGVFNGLLGLNSAAGVSFNVGQVPLGVAAESTFLSGGDIGGLKPSQTVEAVTGALVDPTGAAAACGGRSSSSVFYGAGIQSSGCNVASVIAPLN
eukprot:TRINITY_DN336_c0_g1_i3.p2 TRINITY_DN336_c0_g1~~TRINITY_DN336_c0_g1_i3.p2  ORF type:complete len:231 (-),score=35.44 TRINITY_DN336_c0_g1_i3:250-942(-)